jgi:hypothetical protein
MRRAELCQLPDLPLTLLVSMGLDQPRAEPLWGRNMWQAGPPRIPTQWPPEHTLAWLECGDKLWVRTPAWSLLKTGDAPARLFVKADDRWEVSDIASRRGDVVDQLLALVPMLRAATDQSARDALPKLDTGLTSLLR